MKRATIYFGKDGNVYDETILISRYYELLAEFFSLEEKGFCVYGAMFSDFSGATL